MSSGWQLFLATLVFAALALITARLGFLEWRMNKKHSDGFHDYYAGIYFGGVLVLVFCTAIFLFSWLGELLQLGSLLR